MTVVLNNTGKSGPAKPIVVSVNGVVIPREAIAREIQNHPAEKAITAWQDAVRALVIRELLLQEARRLGLTAQPRTDTSGRRETDEEALLRTLVEREITTPEPDRETCKRYYERNPSRFCSPAVYEASHILFGARERDPVAFVEARRRANEVLAELRLRSERFGELASVYSSCPSGAQGGNLGQITAGQTTPEFEQALFGLEPGSITESPVPTRYGFHIIRLNRKVEKQQLPFDLVAERIADYLRERVVRQATAQFIARVAAKARIEGIALPTPEALRVH